MPTVLTEPQRNLIQYLLQIGMSILDIVSVNRMLAYDEERTKFLRRIKKEHFDAQETMENCMNRVNRRVYRRKV